MSLPNRGRRQFLGGLLAASVAPQVTWADAGSPAFLSAAAKPDGSYVLCGIGADLNIRFELPLPARGHAAAAHPTHPEAVAFARRPGTFAVVIDCTTGTQKAMLTAPTGRHFYGHGAFSSDGRHLFTTENDYAAGRGCIGVWDARNGYIRVDEWDSGGIGPHDIKRLPNTNILVVANGGIDTHPETGRTKLNIATMEPNLVYIEGGTVLETAKLPVELHKNSIRHLAVGDDQHVAFGMQWQGDGPAPSLVGIHQMGQSLKLMTANSDAMRDMQGYVGSIAMSSDGSNIWATSPRGGFVQHYKAQLGEISLSTAIQDVSGVATIQSDVAVSSGTGEMQILGDEVQSLQRQTNLKWDNHLVRIALA